MSAAQQLDLAIKLSSNDSESHINQTTATASKYQPESQSNIITQMIENMEMLTEKVNQLSDNMTKVNAVASRIPPQPRPRESSVAAIKAALHARELLGIRLVPEQSIDSARRKIIVSFAGKSDILLVNAPIDSSAQQRVSRETTTGLPAIRPRVYPQ